MNNETYIGLFLTAAASLISYGIIRGPESWFNAIRIGMEISGKSFFEVFVGLFLIGCTLFLIGLYTLVIGVLNHRRLYRRRR